MKALMALAAGLIFLVAAPAQDNDETKKDKELIKGKWKLESFETEQGKKDDLEGATLSLEAEQMEFKIKEEGKKGTYSINPLGKPKEITFKTDEREMEGIYKLERDTLTICICADGGQPRPLEFAAKSVYVLVTLKRDK